jgi:hypothetical protein
MPTDPGDLFLFPTRDGPGLMESRGAELVAALGLTDPLAAGYGHALILAGRNIDRAEDSRDPGKVDRALSRWVELLGKLGTATIRPEGAQRDDDGPAGPTEFDRYAQAVTATLAPGDAQLLHPAVP